MVDEDRPVALGAPKCVQSAECAIFNASDLDGMDAADEFARSPGARREPMTHVHWYARALGTVKNGSSPSIRLRDRRWFWATGFRSLRNRAP